MLRISLGTFVRWSRTGTFIPDEKQLLVLCNLILLHPLPFCYHQTTRWQRDMHVHGSDEELFQRRQNAEKGQDLPPNVRRLEKQARRNQSHSSDPLMSRLFLCLDHIITESRHAARLWQSSWFREKLQVWFCELVYYPLRKKTIIVVSRKYF